MSSTVSNILRLWEPELSALLAEALRNEPRFRSWFVERLARARSGWSAINESIVEVSACHKDARLDNRETDIWFSTGSRLPSGCGSHLALVEVKICASFQQGQAKDYPARGRKARSLELCNEHLCVLVAPRQYPDAHKADAAEFNAIVPLEEIREFFLDESTAADDAAVDRYVKYRSTIGLALRVYQAGNPPLKSEPREEQFAWYICFVSGYAPHLPLRRKQGFLQARHIFYDLGDTSLTRGYIRHGLFDGEVLIELMQCGHAIDTAIELMTPASGEELIVRHAPNSKATLHILRRGRKPQPLHIGCGFDVQEESLRACVDEVSRLHEWSRDQGSVIREVLTLAALKR